MSRRTLLPPRLNLHHAKIGGTPLLLHLWRGGDLKRDVDSMGHLRPTTHAEGQAGSALESSDEGSHRRCDCLDLHNHGIAQI
jgi:hypothetical protein